MQARFWAVLISFSGGFAWAEPSKFFEVTYDKKVWLYFEQQSDGQVFKAYPKPRVPIGKFVGGVREFTPAKSVSDTDRYYPLVANIVAPRDLGEPELEVLRTLLFKSEGTKIPVDGSSIGPWTGPDAGIDWKKLQLKEVSAKEVEKILAFEKGLLGNWKFAGSKDAFGERKEDLQYAAIEFCDDGKCTVDSKQKFYWVDGRFTRLSFQEKEAWEEYSCGEEYDIIKLDESTLEIRPVAAPCPPSRFKEPELAELYPEDALKRAYYFKRAERKSGK